MPRADDRVNQTPPEFFIIRNSKAIYKFVNHRNSIIRQINERDMGLPQSPTKFAFWDGSEMTTQQIESRLRYVGML